MLSTLSDPARAAIYYVIALALAVIVAWFAPAIGEASTLLTMLTPAVAVLIMLLLVTRDGYMRDGWLALGVTRLGIRLWWLAILGPVGLIILSDLIMVGIGVASFFVPDIDDPAITVATRIVLSLAVGLGFAFAEEIGWRGYMLPRLTPIGVVRAMLIVGFLHGVWHLPLMLTTPYYHSGGDPWIVVPLFLVTLSLAGIFYGYLRLATGSVWPVAIAHAALNFAWEFGNDFMAALPGAREYLGGESGVLMIFGLVLFALILFPRIRRLDRRMS